MRDRLESLDEASVLSLAAGLSLSFSVKPSPLFDSSLLLLLLLASLVLLVLDSL